MKETAELPPVLIKATDLEENWIHDRAVTAQRDGHALRAGLGNTIEAQSINDPKLWGALVLKGNAIAFVDSVNRDVALSALHQEINLIEQRKSRAP